MYSNYHTTPLYILLAYTIQTYTTNTPICALCTFLGIMGLKGYMPILSITNFNYCFVYLCIFKFYPREKWMTFVYLCIKTVYLCTIQTTIIRLSTHYTPLYYTQICKFFQHDLLPLLKIPIIILLLYFLILPSGKT